MNPTCEFITFHRRFSLENKSKAESHTTRCLEAKRFSVKHISVSRSLIVLTRGRAQSTSSSSTDEADKSEEVWQELQADLTTRSSNGKQIIAENSGHYIQYDQPELVVDSISRVINVIPREK